mmetsp:Transcript_45983/g.82797  ORF Transcript_45983/g.82797 Transcript_45983/m.82797 type:complete len:193 (-) Transcript_45983:400-978(-)
MAQLALVTMSGDVILEMQVEPLTPLRELEAPLQEKRPGRQVKSLMFGEECLDLERTVEEIGMASGGTISVVFAPLPVNCKVEKEDETRRFTATVRPAEREEFVVSAERQQQEPQEVEIRELVDKLESYNFGDSSPCHELSELYKLLAKGGTATTYVYNDLFTSGHAFFVEDHIIDLSVYNWASEKAYIKAYF